MSSGAGRSAARHDGDTVVDVGFDLHVSDSGEGNVLVLLHGAGPGVSGSSNFRHNLQTFTTRFRTIVPDLPGFGRSACPELSTPYPQVAAEAIVRLLDEMRIDRAHFLGNSMGAFVAAELALARPELVERLVLMGFGGVGVNILSPVPSEGGSRSREFVAAPTRDRLLAWLESMVEDRDVLTPELIEERHESAMRPGAVEHMTNVRDSMGRTGEAPRWALVERIEAPTLLIWGRDDRMVQWEHALLPLRHMPNVELHVFSRCGHWVQVERRVEFERVVMEFLTR